MSKTSIPELVLKTLWAQAAGRCEFPGCNRVLFRDALTQLRGNSAYVAHIVADEPGGPRGDAELSPKLAKDITNLMLLCDTHHRLVDRERVEEYGVPVLQSFKNAHEDRIERLASIGPDLQSHVVMYGANIGDRTSPLTGGVAFRALADNGRYPAANDPITLGLRGSESRDYEQEYWEEELRNLSRQFDKYVRPLLEHKGAHLSVFALAPQPLLAYFGHLISDLFEVDLYQRQRNPDQWAWYQESGGSLSVQRPTESSEAKNIALVLSISDVIRPERVTAVLDPDGPIWTIAAGKPSVHFLRSKAQLDEFSRVYRQTLAEIKAKYGQNATVHVFPAVPHTLAIEMGRARNPKADLPLVIYDYNNKSERFARALEIR